MPATNTGSTLISAAIRSNEAQTLLERGQVAAAVALAKTAASQYPNSADVQGTLGQTLMAGGQPADGRKALDEAARLSRTIEPGYQGAVRK